MGRALLILPLSILVSCAGCSVRPSASDSGYHGTWVRGSERARSTISIFRDGESYRFRWAKRTDDDRVRVDCDWDGECTELVDQKKTGTYRFRTWIDEETGHLTVECTGTIEEPEAREIHYVDELVLSSDGLRMTAYTVLQNGLEFPKMKGPAHVFDKLSDSVAAPPGREGGP